VDWKRLAFAPRRKFGVRHYEEVVYAKLDTYVGACGNLDRIELLLTAVKGGGANDVDFRVFASGISGVHFTLYDLMMGQDVFYGVPVFIGKDVTITTECWTGGRCGGNPGSSDYMYIIDPIKGELVYTLKGNVRSVDIDRGVYLFVSNIFPFYPCCYAYFVHIPPPSWIASLDINCIVNALRSANVHRGLTIYMGARAQANFDIYGIDLNVEI